MDTTSEGDAKRTEMVLEQYKAYIGDVGSIGARYSGVHKLYFTLLGATSETLKLPVA